MPLNYANYPSNWKTEIRPALLSRAKHRCEVCGVKNYSVGEWCSDGIFLEWDYFTGAWAKRNNKKPTKIILTLAHLDAHGDKCKCEFRFGKKCGEYSHILVMCQRCHLGYDRVRHQLSRKINASTKSNERTSGLPNPSAISTVDAQKH